MPNDLTMVFADVVDRLVVSQHPEWLRVIDAARIDEPVEVDEASADAVRPYSWLIEAVGDGVTLTKAGYLPPAMVARTMTELGWTDRWIGKHNREDQTPHVLELRESSQRLGLLRKLKGRLLVTKLGRRLALDPVELWWLVARRLVDTKDPGEMEASVLYLLQVAAGRSEDDALLAEGMALLGWRGADYGAPTPRQALFASMPARQPLELLDAQTDFWGDPLPSKPKTVAGAMARAALFSRTPPAALPPGELSSQGVQLTITLIGAEPAIWRRVAVPGGYSLRGLDAVIQLAMGWQNSHLHQFEIAGVLYCDQLDDPPPVPMGQEDSLTVGELPTLTRGFRYEYDFGDSWQHEIVLEDADVGMIEVPRVIDGARACPPEDSGGIPGYQDLADALAQPDHPHRTQLVEWVGGDYDPEAFDVAATDDRVATFGRVLNRLRTRTSVG